MWTRRLQITSYVVHISLFGIAAAVELLIDRTSTGAVLGSLLALAGVVVSLTIRVPFDSSSWAVATRLAISIAFYAFAVSATGGIDSAFTLLPVAAIFIAAVGGGRTYALPTAGAGIVAILIVSLANAPDGDPGALIQVAAIYAITAIAFSEGQRAIAAESERTEGLIVASGAAQTRVARLEATHELLADLVKVARSPDVNAVTTARDAVRDIALIIPDTSTRIVTVDNIVLARRGATPQHRSARHIAIVCEGTEVAHIELWDNNTDLDRQQLAAIELAIQPVGLAIDNDILLQKVAGITIQRERARLARELHDDIAPSMAAIGLTLDMALMSGDLNKEQMRNLTASRSNISRLVDQIRDRVQDLRADRSMSIVETAHSLVAEVDADGPTVIVNIDERTPPRAAIAAELAAFMTEAFRNAVRHAGATAIWVTGRITEDEGFLAVQDNGDGFDPDSIDPSRFGLIGMRERAAMISGEFELESTPGSGTVVSMTWKDGST